MLRLAGTEWWPDLRGRILILECPEAPYSLAWADAGLAPLMTIPIGVPGSIRGLELTFDEPAVSPSEPARKWWP